MNPMEQPGTDESTKILSFVELGQKKEATYEDFLATLKDYVDTGAAISSEIAVKLIKRLNLSPEQKEEIKKLAEQGATDQEKRGFKEDARAFKKIVKELH